MKPLINRLLLEGEIAALELLVKDPLTVTPAEHEQQCELRRRLIQRLAAAGKDEKHAWHSCGLAALLTSTPGGVTASQRQEAWGYYIAALQVYEQHGRVLDVAQIHGNLGRLALLAALSSASNARLARNHLLEAEKGIPAEQMPQEWGALQLMLSEAEVLLAQVEGLEVDQHTISRLERACEHFARHNLPGDLAGAYVNLGKLYISRSTGDRGDQIERGLHLLREATVLYTSSGLMQYVATTQINLCIGYFSRLKGPSRVNLNQAIRYGLAACHILERQAWPEPLALASLNLANAYIERWMPGDGGRAKRYLHRALQYYTASEHPDTWGTIHNTFGVLAKRELDAGLPSRDEALEHFAQALRVFDRKSFPERYGVIQRSIAELYEPLIRLGQGDVEAEVLSRLVDAISHLSSEHTPGQFIETAILLGRMYRVVGRLADARQVLEQAHTAAIQQRTAALLLPSRADLVRRQAQLYELLVTVCLRMNDVEAAFHYAEIGKWRSFDDVLSNALAPVIETFDEKDTGKNLRELHAIWLEMDELTEKLLGSRPTTFRTFTREMYLQRLNWLRRRAAELDEQLMYTHPALKVTGQTQTVDARLCMSLATSMGAHFIEYYAHAAGWGAFVISSSGVIYQDLPSVSNKTLADAIRPELWEVDEPRFGEPDSVLTNQADAAQAILCNLYSVFFEPIASFLPPSGRLMIALHGSLHHIPFGALQNSTTGSHLIEHYTLSYTSSLTELALIASRQSKRPTEVPRKLLLSVAYPGKLNDPYFLPHVLEEADAICSIVPGATRIHLDEATAIAFLTQAPQHELIHCGCHGRFHFQYAEQSGLLLAGGWLTIQRLLLQLRLDKTRLCTLGACLSARTTPTRNDSFVGLHQTLLRCGATAVTASPWKVGDAAAAILFQHFYKQLITGISPAEALRDASLELRSRDQFTYPGHWAAFQLYGLGIEPVNTSP